MKKKKIGFIVYIIIILIFDLTFSLKMTIKYKATVRDINELTEAAEIAEKFMRPEYNRSWKEIGTSGQETRDSVDSVNIYEYRVHKDISESNYIYFELWDWSEFWKTQTFESNGKEKGITCIHHINNGEVEISTDYIEKDKPIASIIVSINAFDETYGWGEKYYKICYENGKYNVKSYEDEEYLETDREDFEREVGMTVEEIIDIAYEDQKLFEETMSEIKEYELHRNKEVMWKRLLCANGISCFLLLLGVASKMIDRRYEE